MQEGEALRRPPARSPLQVRTERSPREKKKTHKNHRWNAYLTVRCVTAVLERALLCRRRFTRRYFGLSEIQCLCVSWLQLSVNMRKRWWTKKKKKKKLHKHGHWNLSSQSVRQKLNERERESEVQDKGTSTSSWSSIHQRNRVKDKVKDTQAAIFLLSHFWSSLHRNCVKV